MENLAGRPVTSDSWMGAILTPGFGRCLVKRDRGGLTYECDSPYPTPTAALTAARAQAQKLASCPAVSIVVNNLAKPAPNSGLPIEDIVAGTVGDVLVAVRADDIQSPPRAVLRISVAAPVAAVPPAAGKPDASMSELTDLNTFSPNAQAFCQDIKTIYVELPNGLAGLLGSERTSGVEKTGTGRFNVKVMPAGMERCYIATYPDGRKYYSCTALSDSPKAAVITAAAKLVELMKTCRPGLVVRARIDGEGDASIDLTDPASPGVQGRVWTLHIDDQMWDVMLNLKPAG